MSDNNELERRIRDLLTYHVPTNTRTHDHVTMQKGNLLTLLLEAARIGAEAEREECARIVEYKLAPVYAKHVAQAIRARGAKP